jgi:hypothetical protein
MQIWMSCLLEVMGSVLLLITSSTLVIDSRRRVGVMPLVTSNTDQ